MININGQLPEDQKIPVEPLSDQHGTLKKIKNNLLEVKEAINKGAFATGSVESMKDVLKELHSISGFSPKTIPVNLLVAAELGTAGVAASDLLPRLPLARRELSAEY